MAIVRTRLISEDKRLSHVLRTVTLAVFLETARLRCAANLVSAGIHFPYLSSVNRLI